MIEIDGILYSENPYAKLIRVKSVKPLDGYKLLLTFTNDEKKIYDMSDKLEYEVFKPLSDIDMFRRAYVECGTVTWNDEIDICPDTMYMNSIPI